MKRCLVPLALAICILSVPQLLAVSNTAATVTVDVQANRNAINPLIYGVNYFEASDVTTLLEDLNAPINRYGGNRASTYNWELNSDNRGYDYFFESISDDDTTAGARGDIFINATQAAQSEPMVTIPMLDWIAKAGTAQPFLCSYPKTAYPTQAAFDQYDPNCGDGLTPDLSLINGADPTVALTQNSLDTQQSWVEHIIGAFGYARNTGLKYYILDNEHDLWWETHHDATPNAPHNTDDFNRMVSYASMIKTLDPNAIVVGPEISGWTGYLLSPADWEYGQVNGYGGGINSFPDRMSIGDMDYAPWLLSQFQAFANSHGGQRLIDIFTVHYYPQGGDNNMNTRSLWDPNYVDPSWIDDKIMLIPRMKAWVAGNYPGTKIGITEYNWGNINDEADNDNMGYAVNQADVLGIFGREGLDLATRFNAPIPGLPSYNAMKMYRNYDGSKSTFGDVSLSASVANPDTIAAFAAQRTSDNKITVMILSKYAMYTTPVTVNLSNFISSGTAQVWQLSGTGTSIQRLADATVNNSSISLTLPAQSITLLVLSPATALASVSTSSINFGSQLLNGYSANSSVRLTNTGGAALTISSISVSGAGLFESSDCPASLAVAASCTISLAPTALGSVSGTLSVYDNAPDSPQLVAVTGNGITIVTVPVRPARGPVSPTGSQPASGIIDLSVDAPVSGAFGCEYEDGCRAHPLASAIAERPIRMTLLEPPPATPAQFVLAIPSVVVADNPPSPADKTTAQRASKHRHRVRARRRKAQVQPDRVAP